MVELSQKKARYAKTKTHIEGRRLMYNASQQKRYEKQLRELVDEMTSITKNEFKILIDNQTPRVTMDADTDNDIRPHRINALIDKIKNKFENLFGQRALKIAMRMVQDTNLSSYASMHSSLKHLTGLSLPINKIGVRLTRTIKKSVYENVKLIKSIPDEYLDKINKAVQKSILSEKQGGLNNLIKIVQKYDGVTQRRARNIALDQTRKVFNHMNRDRSIDAGITKFKWLHSGGGQHPRKEHMDLNGKIFSYDDLPIISAPGEPEVRGIPGQAINCRCTTTPVLSIE